MSFCTKSLNKWLTEIHAKQTLSGCFCNFPMTRNGKQKKVKRQSKTVTLKTQNTRTQARTQLLIEYVPCFLPVVSPIINLNHKGCFHVYLATVDDGTVGEWTIVPISCLKLYGVDHCLVREKQTWDALLTCNYDHQKVKTMPRLKAQVRSCCFFLNDYKNHTS